MVYSEYGFTFIRLAVAC